MLKIDLENHFYDQSLIEAFSKRTKTPRYDENADLIFWNDAIRMPQGELLKTLLDIGEKRISIMDREGIDVAVLSSAGGPELLETEDSIEVCRKTNDTLAELTKKYPGRFLGSAVIPVKDTQAAAAELERCVKELGFVCWHTHSNYGEMTPDDERFRPLFKKAADLGVYVYLHPHLPVSDRMEGFGFTFAGPGLGFTVDTVTTIMRMIVSGLFDEIPGLKMVLGHLGEGIPFLLDRIDNRISFLPNAAIKCKHTVRYYFEHNIWVTTSGNMSASAFECTKKELGMDHILFGSDFPFEDVHEMVSFLKALPLDEEEQRMLYYENAISSLGIADAAIRARAANEAAYVNMSISA